MDISARPYIADVNTHLWMTAFPSYRPSWEGPCGSKYTIENSLPSSLHGIRPHNTCCCNVAIPYPKGQQGLMMNAAATTKAEASLPSSSLHCSKVHDDCPLKPDSTTSVPAESDSFVSPTSVEHLPDPISGTVIPAELIPSSVENDPDSVDSSTPAESVPSSLLEQVSHPPDLASNTTLPLSDSSVIYKSLEEDVQSPASARNTSEELELPGVVEHANHHPSCASNTAMPAIQGIAIDARPLQKKRRRHHLAARLKEAISQRLFSHLRTRVLML